MAHYSIIGCANLREGPFHPMGSLRVTGSAVSWRCCPTLILGDSTFRAIEHRLVVVPSQGVCTHADRTGARANFPKHQAFGAGAKSVGLLINFGLIALANIKVAMESALCSDFARYSTSGFRWGFKDVMTYFASPNPLAKSSASLTLQGLGCLGSRPF